MPIGVNTMIYFSDDKGSKLDGSWKTLIPPRTPEDTDPTLEDLYKIASEYGTRDEKNKAPVMLGSLSQSTQQPVGRIDEVRCKGNSLEGKFGAVDPRVDYLHGRGAFPKTSVRFKRSPDGVSLVGVGLVHPKWIAGSPRNNETPSLDELMKEHTGMQESIFGETMNRPDFSGGHIEIDMDAPEIRRQVAQNVISDLKKRGRWSNRFERDGLPALLASVAGTPLFKPTVNFVEGTIEYYIAHDPTAAFLAECANYYARENGVTYAEALDTVATPHFGPYWAAGPNPDSQGGAWGAGVSPEQRDMERKTSQQAVKNNVLPAEIVDLAWKRAEAKNMPFKQALVEVTAEHPEIMKAFQLTRLRANSSGGKIVSTGNPASDMAYTLAAQKNIQFSEALSQVAEEYGVLVNL